MPRKWVFWPANTCQSYPILKKIGPSLFQATFESHRMPQSLLPAVLLVLPVPQKAGAANTYRQDDDEDEGWLQIDLLINVPMFEALFCGIHSRGSRPSNRTRRNLRSNMRISLRLQVLRYHDSWNWRPRRQPEKDALDNFRPFLRERERGRKRGCSPKS